MRDCRWLKKTLQNKSKFLRKNRNKAYLIWSSITFFSKRINWQTNNSNYNLKPRKIMEIESQGMIFFAENENEKLSFATTNKNVPNGYILR